MAPTSVHYFLLDPIGSKVRFFSNELYQFTSSRNFLRMYLVLNLGICLVLRGQRIKEPPVGYEPTMSSLQMRCSYQLS